MSSQESGCLASDAQEVDTFVEKVLDGVVIAAQHVPEGVEALLESKEQLRNKALELYADSVFYQAAKRLVELLQDEDPKVGVQAAKALLDLRRDVYKVQSSRKAVKALANKLFDDGFEF
jgi:hypothetical protein